MKQCLSPDHFTAFISTIEAKTSDWIWVFIVHATEGDFFWTFWQGAYCAGVMV